MYPHHSEHVLNHCAMATHMCLIYKDNSMLVLLRKSAASLVLSMEWNVSHRRLKLLHSGILPMVATCIGFETTPWLTCPFLSKTKYTSGLQWLQKYYMGTARIGCLCFIVQVSEAGGDGWCYDSWCNGNAMKVKDGHCSLFLFSNTCQAKPLPLQSLCSKWTPFVNKSTWTVWLFGISLVFCNTRQSRSYLDVTSIIKMCGESTITQYLKVKWNR